MSPRRRKKGTKSDSTALPSYGDHHQTHHAPGVGNGMTPVSPQLPPGLIPSNIQPIPNVNQQKIDNI